MKSNILNIESVIKDLPRIKKIIEECSNDEQIGKLLKLMKEVESNVSKLEKASGLDAILLHSRLAEKYVQLRELAESGGLSYVTASLFSPSSDKLKVFNKYSSTFDDQTYWRELASAYTMQDHMTIPRKLLVELFSANRSSRNSLMTDEELASLMGLPETITIFRGGAESEERGGKFGISWTLDRDVAERFASIKASKTSSKMKLYQRIIRKEEVVALFLSRQEQEVIWLG